MVHNPRIAAQLRLERTLERLLGVAKHADQPTSQVAHSLWESTVPAWLVHALCDILDRIEDRVTHFELIGRNATKRPRQGRQRPGRGIKPVVVDEDLKVDGHCVFCDQTECVCEE